MSGYIITAIVILILIVIIAMYNTMLSKKNKMLKAYSSLDVMLKKRYDLIPNIVETVKAYKNYEAEALKGIIELRQKADACKDVNDLKNIDGKYNSFMTEVHMLAESYPELKAEENFMHLQKALNEVEEQISAARRTYNAHVENFNTFISFFPVNIFACIFRFEKVDFFEATEEEKASNRLTI